MSFSDIAISVRAVSKSYQIAHNSARATTLAEALMRRVRHPFRPGEEETFWALNDVSFDVKRGEVVGIIGRNGAGKSTLLKILSRITEPTSGEIDVYGRVGSLLEVGTGFHPELTGRENIFLNGGILGMSRREITRQFDAIVEFSEVEKFLDTPVKRYSSGMYVRLAFAVAAHLEPEILVVDEVLAVGDVEFQKKCLQKMKDVSSSGRTVLFVSHNTAAVRQFCDTGVLLERGTLKMHGPVQDVLQQYLARHSESISNRATSAQGLELRAIDFVDAESGAAAQTLHTGGTYDLRLQVVSPRLLDNAAVVMRLHSEAGELVSSICTPEEGIPSVDLQGGMEFSFRLRPINLVPGNYSISLSVHRLTDWSPYLDAPEILSFAVDPPAWEASRPAYDKRHGMLVLGQGATVREWIPAGEPIAPTGLRS